MTYHKHASLHIAQRDRHGRNLEQFVTSNELAEMPDVLSHRVKLLRLAGRHPGIYHHWHSAKTDFVNEVSAYLP